MLHASVTSLRNQQKLVFTVVTENMGDLRTEDKVSHIIGCFTDALV